MDLLQRTFVIGFENFAVKLNFEWKLKSECSNEFFKSWIDICISEINHHCTVTEN